jgi:hypothetical protein
MHHFTSSFAIFLHMSTPTKRKSFNTTGPCFPEKHYMLPPQKRLPARDLQRLVDEELYWVLHAPRQTGKTSFLMSWMESLNAQEDVVACYVSVERCQGVEDMAQVIPMICSSILSRAELYLPKNLQPDPQECEPGSQLHELLRHWAKKVGQHKLVLLFDEVDVLVGPALISFLRQLRDGFVGRGVGRFPTSVALVGMRDLKDYLVTTKDGVALNPGSPFNIKKESYTLRNFYVEEVGELLRQHTQATGQVFTDEAIEKVFALSGGQPWLVNTMADLCVNRIVPEGEIITADHIDSAREVLIESRAVHVDSLAERLKDPRVKRVVQPILAGNVDLELGRQHPDVMFCMDLGLVTWDDGLVIANPIYREVLIRTLNTGMQDGMVKPEIRWTLPDGNLDMDALMQAFQAFWREHGDIWEQKADYTEVFPQLLLMAFFQRLLNGGARLTREVAAGKERMDMLIEWKGWKHIIEIKMVHPRHGRDTTLQKGMQQIASYFDKVGSAGTTQTLAIFDRTPAGRAMPWSDRLRKEENGAVTVWWM